MGILSGSSWGRRAGAADLRQIEKFTTFLKIGKKDKNKCQIGKIGKIGKIRKIEEIYIENLKNYKNCKS